MGIITDTATNVFRDFLTVGVPASGSHEPVKPEIRALFATVESAQATALLGSVAVVKTTRALLNADLAHPADTVALVYADATNANNDLYVKTGAPGAGAWTLTGALHGAVDALTAETTAALEAYADALRTTDNDPTFAAYSDERVATQRAVAASDMAGQGAARESASRAWKSQTASIFVSNVEGNDAANGTTPARAKATLAGGTGVLAAGETLALFTGSLFRASLSVLDEQSVVAAGDGAGAIIDGADIVTGWTAHATAADVWEKSIAFDTSVDTAPLDRLRAYKNGALLARVANVAACSATPNSFVDVDRSDGTPVTFQINVGAGINPVAALVEVTVRTLGLHTSFDADVFGPLHVKRVITNNGGIVIRGRGNLERILAQQGTKHNFFLGKGRAFGSVALEAENPTAYEGSNTLFVSYLDDPTGESYEYEACGAVQPDAYGSAFSGTAAFLAHGAAPGLVYATGTLRQCWGVGPISGGHAGGTAANVETGCYWRGLSLLTAKMDSDIDYSIGYLPLVVGGISAYSNQLSEQNFGDCAYYFVPRTNVSPPCFQLAGRDSDNDLAVTLDHGAFVMGKVVGFGAHMFSTGPANGGSLTCNFSIIAGCTGYAIWLPVGVGYVGNNNIFWARNQFQDDTKTLFQRYLVDHDTLAGWQAATGQDANSCYIKDADQVAGGANALWQAWSEADGAADLSLIGPPQGDFRINPLARVYSGTNVAYIGTFPSGAPLAGAGPQGHWDWNLRGVLSGPPVRFPRVPITETDCLDYIESPRGWVF